MFERKKLNKTMNKKKRRFEKKWKKIGVKSETEPI